MELSSITNIEDFLKVRDDWNCLAASCENGSVFLTHEWLENWWRSYGSGDELLIITATDGGRLAAAVPLKLTRDKLRGLPVDKISFMGGSTWTTGDILASPPVNEDVIKKLAKALLDIKWDIIDLQNVCTESRAIGLFCDVLGSKGISNSRVDGTSFPFLDVDTTWDDFFSSRSTRFRKATRNKLNKVKKAGQTEVRKCSTPEEVELALPVIFDIGRKGWKHTIKGSVSSTEENIGFYTGLSRTMSALGLLDIWILSLDGVDIAFEYHIRYKDSITALVGDFDEKYRDLSPGSVLDVNIMQRIFADGRYTYNMGSGNSFYKANWTDKAMKFDKVLFYRNTLYGSLLKFTERSVITRIKGLRDRFRKENNHGAARDKVA